MMPMHLIRRAIAGWESHLRRKRFARLMMSSKAYRAAHEALERDRRLHKPTRAELKAKREALHAELRREVLGC